MTTSNNFRLRMMRERLTSLVQVAGHRFGHVGGGTRCAYVDGLTVRFEGREIVCEDAATVVDTLLTWGYA